MVGIQELFSRGYTQKGGGGTSGVAGQSGRLVCDSSGGSASSRKCLAAAKPADISNVTPVDIVVVYCKEDNKGRGEQTKYRYPNAMNLLY